MSGLVPKTRHVSKHGWWFSCAGAAGCPPHSWVANLRAGGAEAPPDWAVLPPPSVTSLLPCHCSWILGRLSRLSWGLTQTWSSRISATGASSTTWFARWPSRPSFLRRPHLELHPERVQRHQTAELLAQKCPPASTQGAASQMEHVNTGILVPFLQSQNQQFLRSLFLLIFVPFSRLWKQEWCECQLCQKQLSSSLKLLITECWFFTLCLLMFNWR